MQSGIRTLPVEGRFERIISVDVTPLSVEDSIPGARTAAILAWWREAQAPLGYVPKSRFDIIEHLELAPNLLRLRSGMTTTVIWSGARRSFTCSAS